jgi:menaquinone-9 beta-reductase
MDPGDHLSRAPTKESAMRVFDVVIVGAGPAGGALATYLARDGYAVLLLEKSRFPRDKICGDLVSAKGLKLLADIGCLDQITRRGYLPIEESLVYLDDELLAKGSLPRLPAHPPFGHAIPRAELDELIFRQALASGAHAVENCKVTSYEIAPSLVTVVAEVENQRQRFLGRVLIGADGAGSVIARCAGLDMRDSRHVQLAMRAYCHGLPVKHAVLFFAEDFFPGYGWIFPVSEQLANIGVGMVKESAQRDRLHLKRFYKRFLELVDKTAREHGANIELTQPAGWPIKTYGGADRNYFERGLLIGDAGCFVDPISGEGIPLALQSAELAAATIREVFAAGEFGSTSMAQFETRWRSRFDVDLNVSDLIVSAARNRHLVKVWIQWLRVMALTASQDRDYALKLGGILAGLVSGREGFSVEVFLKSVMHGPAFWLKALNLSPSNLPGDLLRGLAEFLNYETRDLASIPTEARWLGDWATEIARKQIKVFTR